MNSPLSPSRLLRLRTWLNLSQEALARLLGVSFASVNRWERGRGTPHGMVLEAYIALHIAERARMAVPSIYEPSITTGEKIYRIFRLAYGKGNR